MTCPYCGRDLLSLTWKYWSGNGSERFEIICPECGNSVVVMAKLSFAVYKHQKRHRWWGDRFGQKEILDEI